jgi:hypothetical protein
MLHLPRVLMMLLSNAAPRLQIQSAQRGNQRQKETKNKKAARSKSDSDFNLAASAHIQSLLLLRSLRHSFAQFFAHQRQPQDAAFKVV